MILIFIFGIFCVPTEQKVIQYCPDQQVLHVDPSTKLAFCCYPVRLPRGHEYVPCWINGTNDSIRMCPKGLFQEDETTTESEATCTAEKQCVNNENLRVLNCDKKGENCIPACVCNYPAGFCGTEYYDCRPFPKDCPKEYVQEDCSCNKSFPYGSSTHTTEMPGSDVTSQKKSTVTFIPSAGKPEINTNNDTVPTIFENNSTSGPGLEQEKSGFPVLPVVGIVIIIGIAIAILAFVVVHYHVPLSNSLLCIIKNCRRCGQTEDYVVVPLTEVVVEPTPPIVPPPGKPTAEVKPRVLGLSQENRGGQSFNMCDESEGAQNSPNVLAQIIPDLPNDIDEVPAVPFEGPPSIASDQIVIGPLMEDWVTLSPISSISFDSDNTSPKQIESDYDNTAVKQVEDVTDQTRRVEVEENQLQCIAVNHQHGTADLPSADPRFQSGSSGWSSFSDNINNSTSSQIVNNQPGDFHIQEEEVEIVVKEEI